MRIGLSCFPKSTPQPLLVASRNRIWETRWETRKSLRTNCFPCFPNSKNHIPRDFGKQGRAEWDPGRHLEDPSRVVYRNILGVPIAFAKPGAIPFTPHGRRWAPLRCICMDFATLGEERGDSTRGDGRAASGMRMPTRPIVVSGVIPTSEGGIDIDFGFAPMSYVESHRGELSSFDLFPAPDFGVAILFRRRTP